MFFIPSEIFSMKCVFFCSDQLKRHYNLGHYWLEVELEDLTHFDASLAEKLVKQPAEHLPLVNN
jgi:MCM N-terminal domain